MITSDQGEIIPENTGNKSADAYYNNWCILKLQCLLK